jgi:hypothetical protein
VSDQSTAGAEDESEGVEETLDELSETVEETEADNESETDDAADETTSAGDADHDINALIDRATDDIEALLTASESDEPFEEVREDIDDLIAVVEEIEELLETIDLTDLPEAVDISELPDAIETGEVPDAIAAGDPGETVKYRKLLQVVELGELWDAVDVREFWRNKRELDDATDEVTDSEDVGPMEKFREFVGDDGSDGDAGDVDGDSGEGGDGAADTGGGSDRADIDVPTETIQQRVQSKLSDAVGEFRESLLDTREHVQELKEENEDRTDDVGQPDSRNPTAYSSIPTARNDMSGTAAFSTVPEETRYSSAPNRPRLYGSRLDRAAEERDE